MINYAHPFWIFLLSTNLSLTPRFFLDPWLVLCRANNGPTDWMPMLVSVDTHGWKHVWKLLSMIASCECCDGQPQLSLLLGHQFDSGPTGSPWQDSSVKTPHRSAKATCHWHPHAVMAAPRQTREWIAAIIIRLTSDFIWRENGIDS